MTTRRSRSLSVLLTEEEYRRLDSYCSKNAYKKSTLVAKLIREHLEASQGDGKQHPFAAKPS